MNCRNESIFLLCSAWWVAGLRTTDLNKCGGSYQIHFINKKLVWDGYLIALRYRLFIQSYIHNSFDLIFVKLSDIYIYIYI